MTARRTSAATMRNNPTAAQRQASANARSAAVLTQSVVTSQADVAAPAVLPAQRRDLQMAQEHHKRADEILLTTSSPSPRKASSSSGDSIHEDPQIRWQQQAGEALEEMAKAVEIEEALLPPNDRLARSLEKIACLAQSAGHYELAAEYASKLVQVRTKVLSGTPAASGLALDLAAAQNLAATLLLSQKKFHDAVEPLLQPAAKVVMKLAPSSSLAMDIRTNLGHALKALGKLDEAKTHFMAILHTLEDTDGVGGGEVLDADGSLLPIAHCDYASVLKAQGLQQDALAHLSKALELDAVASDRLKRQQEELEKKKKRDAANLVAGDATPGQGGAAGGKGKSPARRREQIVARDESQAALFHGRMLCRPHILNQLGLALKAQGQREKALEHHLEALRLLHTSFDKSPDVTSSPPPPQSSAGGGATALLLLGGNRNVVDAAGRELCTTLTYIAALHRMSRKFPEAIETLQQVKKLQECHGTAGGGRALDVATTLSLLGAVHDACGDHAAALQCYADCLTIRKRFVNSQQQQQQQAANKRRKPPGPANDRASPTTDNQQRDANASMVMSAAEASAWLLVASAHNNIGMAYLSQKDYTSAVDHCLECLRLEELVSPNSISVAAVASNLGAVYKASGRYRLAMEMYEKCLAVQERSSSSSSASLGNGAASSVEVVETLENLIMLVASAEQQHQVLDMERRAEREAKMKLANELRQFLEREAAMRRLIANEENQEHQRLMCVEETCRPSAAEDMRDELVEKVGDGTPRSASGWKSSGDDLKAASDTSRTTVLPLLVSDGDELLTHPPPSSSVVLTRRSDDEKFEELANFLLHAKGKVYGWRVRVRTIRQDHAQQLKKLAALQKKAVVPVGGKKKTVKHVTIPEAQSPDERRQDNSPPRAYNAARGETRTKFSTQEVSEEDGRLDRTKPSPGRIGLRDNSAQQQRRSSGGTSKTSAIASKGNERSSSVLSSSSSTGRQPQLNPTTASSKSPARSSIGGRSSTERTPRDGYQPSKANQASEASGTRSWSDQRKYIANVVRSMSGGRRPSQQQPRR